MQAASNLMVATGTGAGAKLMRWRATLQFAVILIIGGVL
jgi:hypothetical protein